MNEDSSDVNRKPEMLVVMTTTWMLTAVACAALPFLHAVPDLKSAGNIVLLLTALAIGVLVAVPLGIVSSRVCEFGSAPSHAWYSFAPRQAAVLGVTVWGVPVGLILSLNEFLASADFLAVVPGVVIWPLAGVAFGLAMRWFAQRK